MKRCPYCAEEIQDAAIVCRFCGRAIAPAPPTVGGLPTAPPIGPVSVAPPPPAMPPPRPRPEDEPLQFTHSGRRLLLGYGRDFFGIWDRASPASPASRYPRTDEGWRAAWLAFTSEEPDHAEVGLAAGRATATSHAAAYDRPAVGTRPERRSVSGAWWLLPIFMGWLGGLIAWLVNKDVDPDKARAMLVTGIVISLALFAAFALFSAPVG